MLTLPMLQTARYRFLYILADFISMNLAWLVFNIVRYYTLPYTHPSFTLSSYLTFPMVVSGQILFPLMMVVLFALSGYYNKIFFKSRLDDMINAFSTSLVGSVIIFFMVLFNDSIDDRIGNIETIAILWGILAVFCSVPRLLLTSHIANQIRKQNICFNTIILGDNDIATRLADELEKKHRNMGHRVVGIAPISAVGATDGIAKSLDIDNDKLESVDSFIIAPGANANIQDIISVINTLLPTGKRVLTTPDLMQALSLRPRTSMVAGQVLIDISNANVPPSTTNFKRLGDICFSSIALVLSAPVIAVLAIAIKLDSPGSVIYKQQRIGYKKKPFNILKLRTMHVDAESEGPALSSLDDKRITKVGRILRKYRLDELPQFWNVLKGEMSVVGPRPERQYYLDQIIARAPYSNILHQVRPGITSWGMVKYGYASNVEQMIQRLKYDIIYIENVSFAVDMKILFYTIRTVLTGKGI